MRRSVCLALSFCAGLPTVAAAAAAGDAVWASTTPAPLLPASAFQTLRGCPLEPFVPLDPKRLEQLLRERCRQPQTSLAPLGLGSLRREGQQAQGRLGHELAWRAHDLQARLRLGLAAGLAPGAVSARAELAAGLWWQPDRSWGLNLRVGGRHDEDGDTEHRWAVTSVWRPTTQHVLFSRWHLQDDDAAHELGLRWWLVAERVSLDLLWPTADGEPEGASVSLSWRGLDL